MAEADAGENLEEGWIGYSLRGPSELYLVLF